MKKHGKIKLEVGNFLKLKCVEPTNKCIVIIIIVCVFIIVIALI